MIYQSNANHEPFESVFSYYFDIIKDQEGVELRGQFLKFILVFSLKVVMWRTFSLNLGQTENIMAPAPAKTILIL